MAERTCLGCRKTCDQRDLVRFTLDPDGSKIVVDYRHKLPGRGVYTCAARECLQAAVKTRQFQWGLRTQTLQVDTEELAAALRARIVQYILALLGMARKMSASVVGTRLVSQALEKGEPLALLFVASDMSPNIAAKVLFQAERLQIPVCRLYDKDALGQIWGRSESSVVAIRSGALAQSLLKELDKLDRV